MRVSYARRKYYREFRSFLRSNRRGLAAICVVILTTALATAAVTGGYFLGLIHGALASAIVALVVLSFMANTGSIWQMAGAWGEDNTAAELKAAKRHGDIWGWVDNIELAGTDIDHLVLHPGGVLALDSKWHAHALRRSDVEMDVTSAIRSSRKARSVLRSLGTVREVTPVVVIWGRAHRDITLSGSQWGDVDFVPGPHLRAWLRERPGGTLDKVEADLIHAKLRKFRRRTRPGDSMRGSTR